MPRRSPPSAHAPRRCRPCPGTRRVRACALLLAIGWAGAVQADPGYYLFEPYETAGSITVETRYWDVSRHGRAATAWPEFGLTLGVNSRWTSGVLWSWIGQRGGPFTLNTFNWTNDMLLTQGNWPLDVALHTQWVRDPKDRGGGGLEAGPMLQTDFGRTRVNLNLLWERGLGNDSALPAQLKMQWQLRHRWTRGFHVGLQGFSELGPWDHWAVHKHQSHRAGPALFGQAGMGQEGRLALSAAWLEGRTFGHSGRMLTLRAALTY